MPLLFAEWLNRPDLSWTAIVAFWTCLADPGGPSRTRRRTTTCFALGVVAGCFIAPIIRPYLWPSAIFALVWCFTANFARVWGNAAASTGTLLGIAVLVVLGLSQPSSLRAAAAFAGYTLAGALWAMLLVLVIWRQHPYAPARTALASSFRALAAYARVLPDLREQVTLRSELDRLSSQRRRACREAIEASRALLVSTRRDRAGPSMRGQHLILMLADAERAFAALLALSELLEGAATISAPHEERLRTALIGLADRMETVAARLQGRPAADGGKLPSSGSEIIEDENLRHANDLLRRAAAWIEAAAEHLSGASAQGPLPEEALLPDPSIGLLAALTDNLTLGSLALRHAARFAVTGAVLVLVTNGLHLERGYWITLTAVAVLQVYPSATWQRALERVGGSILGGLIAAGAAFVLHGPGETTLLILPLSVLTMAVRGMSYALFVLCLTPQFVLVAELFQTTRGLTPHLGDLRAVDSVIGASIGLLASFMLWPSWEGQYLRQRLAEDVRCNGHFLAAALDARIAGPCETEVEQSRRRAGLASNNAEASLQRVLGEPLRQTGLDIGAALTITAATRRLAGVAAAIAQVAPDLPTSADLAGARDWLPARLEAIASAISVRERPALGPGLTLATADSDVLAQEIVRAWRQVSILEEAAEQLSPI